MTIQEQISKFMTSPAYAVAGASSNRQKFGNRVLRCYLQNGKNAFPVNPNESEIEGIPCVANIRNLPSDVQSLSIITPPMVTVQIVKEAIEHGIRNIWMQPGAGHPDAVNICQDNGVNVIADGSCILVVMGYSDHA